MSAYHPKAVIVLVLPLSPRLAEGAEELLKKAFSAEIGEHRQMGELLSY